VFDVTLSSVAVTTEKPSRFLLVVAMICAVFEGFAERSAAYRASVLLQIEKALNHLVCHAGAVLSRQAINYRSGMRSLVSRLAARLHLGTRVLFAQSREYSVSILSVVFTVPREMRGPLLGSAISLTFVSLLACRFVHLAIVT